MKVYVVRCDIAGYTNEYYTEDIIGIYSTIDKAKIVLDKEYERIINEYDCFDFVRFNDQEDVLISYIFKRDDYHGGYDEIRLYVKEMEMEV